MDTNYELEEYMVEFRTKGIECNVIIENIGYNNGTRAVATAAFGIIGLAGTMGTKNLKKPGRLYIKEKGLRFIPRSLSALEIRIPWDNIIHAGIDYSKIFIYTFNEDKIVFSTKSANVKILKEIIQNKSPNLLEKDMEGWN